MLSGALSLFKMRNWGLVARIIPSGLVRYGPDSKILVVRCQLNKVNANLGLGSREKAHEFHEHQQVDIKRHLHMMGRCPKELRVRAISHDKSRKAVFYSCQVGSQAQVTWFNGGLRGNCVSSTSCSCFSQMNVFSILSAHCFSGYYLQLPVSMAAP
jgi:hypothetical protein